MVKFHDAGHARSLSVADCEAPPYRVAKAAEAQDLISLGGRSTIEFCFSHVVSRKLVKT
jgi:hypothetical protein